MKITMIMTILSGLLFIPAAVALAADENSHALSSEGNAEAGKRVFATCRACHNLTGDKKPRTGPNLDHLFGRTAGTSESFTRYSKALKESGIVWSEQDLDSWLAKPRAFLPGNKMPFPGIRDEQKRKDLIAYLRKETAEDE